MDSSNGASTTLLPRNLTPTAQKHDLRLPHDLSIKRHSRDYWEDQAMPI